MKALCIVLFCVATTLVFTSSRGLGENEVLDKQLRGAWIRQNDNQEQVLLFIDGYTTQSIYSKPTKLFAGTRGGTYKIDSGILNILYEFDTKSKEQIGQYIPHTLSIEGNELTIGFKNEKLTYKRIDSGSKPLAGLWSITGRMQNGKIAPIHHTGTRKTIKILSGKRFQWAAIDPGAKQFSGTGGGTYDFANGKYTEHIEFFSKDSSRVGASVSFDGRLEDSDWHHSGLSSKGDKIYELWSKVKN